MTTDHPHRMTIAFDAKRAFLNYRGLGNYSRNLLAQLAHFYGENRYLLCTPRDKNTYPWLSEAPMERIMPESIWRLVPSLWRRFGIPSSLRNEKIDIYHGLSQELPEGIEKLKCKTVVTMHDAIFMRYPELYSSTYRHSFIRRNISACRRADLIIAISEQTKQDYMEFFGVEENRIRVVYQGCSDIFWKPVSEEQLRHVKTQYSLPDAYILSVGALEERKNQLRQIEAIVAAHINMPLVLVGRGNTAYRQQIRQRAEKHHIHLQIIENAAPQDLPAIYRMASVFVYPSLFEGFGIPILEAARCQTPIIASSGTCFEEITSSEGALYVCPTDTEALADALCKTIQNTEEAILRVQCAFKNTEKFRAETRAQEMIKIYEDLIR